MDTGTEMFRVGAGAVGASMWNTVKDYFGRMCKVGSYIEKAFAVFDYAKKHVVETYDRSYGSTMNMYDTFYPYPFLFPEGTQQREGWKKLNARPNN